MGSSYRMAVHFSLVTLILSVIYCGLCGISLNKLNFEDKEKTFNNKDEAAQIAQKYSISIEKDLRKLKSILNNFEKDLGNSEPTTNEAEQPYNDLKYLDKMVNDVENKLDTFEDQRSNGN